MREPIHAAPCRFKLAAIDLDGTLLGHDLTISPENRAAIQRLQSLGVEVVLASGRHYDSMRPFADQIPNVHWIVSVQGGEVADLERKLILRRKYLAATEVQRVLELGHKLGFLAIVYTPDGIYSEAEPGGADLEFYRCLAGHTPNRVGLADLLTLHAFKIIWIGDATRIAALPDMQEIDTLVVQKVQTHAKLFEFMPDSVTKGTGLAVLAKHLGIASEEAVVFGDAENDIPMFKWAGTSVAMPHGWPTALARATHIAPTGPPETAVARAIEMVLKLS